MGLFALQIASAMGAKVTVTSSSEDKLARARQLGASYTLNYRVIKNWKLYAFFLLLFKRAGCFRGEEIIGRVVAREVAAHCAVCLSLI